MRYSERCINCLRPKALKWDRKSIGTDGMCYAHITVGGLFHQLFEGRAREDCNRNRISEFKWMEIAQAALRDRDKLQEQLRQLRQLQPTEIDWHSRTAFELRISKATSAAWDNLCEHGCTERTRDPFSNCMILTIDQQSAWDIIRAAITDFAYREYGPKNFDSHPNVEKS